MKTRNTNTRKRINTPDDIKGIEKACRIVAETFIELEKHLKPGIETRELDKIAEDFIRSKGASPAFKGYHGFPYTLCISIDEEVVHGMPGYRKIKDGEIVSIDCGAKINGYFGDSAVSYGIGKLSDTKIKLLEVTNTALFLGIEQAVDNNKVYDISRAIQTFCESQGFSLTRELVGHGIGKNLHEEPAIPNFVPPLLHRASFPNDKLMCGMALAIEPMVQSGSFKVLTDSDGWTVRTQDGKPAAHFEHTVIVQEKKPVILTLRN